MLAVGHIDSQGNFQYNRDPLLWRVRSIVRLLPIDYGINAMERKSPESFRAFSLHGAAGDEPARQATSEER